MWAPHGELLFVGTEMTLAILKHWRLLVTLGCTLLLGIAIGLLQEKQSPKLLLQGPTRTSLFSIPVHRYIGSLLPTWPSYEKGTQFVNHETLALPAEYIQVRAPPSSTFSQQQQPAESLSSRLVQAGARNQYFGNVPSMITSPVSDGGSDHRVSGLQVQQTQLELKKMQSELKRTEMVSCTHRRHPLTLVCEPNVFTK